MITSNVFIERATKSFLVHDPFNISLKVLTLAFEDWNNLLSQKISFFHCT